MASKDNRCPHCGDKLPSDSLNGICPKCFMKAGLASDSSVTLESSMTIEGPGTKIGHYELLELIGEGGMGMVYLAQQKEPIRRKVVLKIVKPGMDSAQIIGRFEAERQVLAILDHPNIARVFDAGTTEMGRPYFAMEYVKGISITRYCDEKKLNIEQRLRLFEQVCEAIHHAHQKGIIHRDIKPSNILVCVHGDKAVPKIIDFGIAKAITQPLTNMTFVTFHGQILGTPEYMSPEQVDSATQDIDIRSDIYSLGVVLYELLAGFLPYEEESFGRHGFADMQRIIRELEPVSPSIRLTKLGERAKTIATSRSTQVVPLARRLQRELEWIPLKAMRKDRCRRYRSASEMADDIRNYLSGRPLIAGPETAIYRTKKFVQKHAGSVATVALVTVVILIGSIVSTTMYFIAEQERIEAERQAGISQAVVDYFNKDLFGSINPDNGNGREITVMQVLNNAAENLDGKFKDTPLIEASIRYTLGSTYMNLGNYKVAETYLNRALELRVSELGEEHQDTLGSMEQLGWLYFNQRRIDDAIPEFEKVLEINQKVLGKKHLQTLNSMAHLGLMYCLQGRYDESILLLENALENQRLLPGEEHRDTLWTRHNLGLVYYYQGDYDKAKELLEATLKISPRVYGRESSEVLWTRLQLGWVFEKQGLYKKAKDIYEDVLDIWSRKMDMEYIDLLKLNAMFHLAQLLAECPVDELRDGKRAIGYAASLCEHTEYKEGQFLAILAAGYAEAGDFDSALKWLTESKNLVPEDASFSELRNRIEFIMNMYRQKKPFRLPVVSSPLESQ